MILAILGGVFLILCAFAAVHDIHRLTIPNWLNLTLVALFVPAVFVSGLPMEMIGGHALAAGVAFLAAFGLFAFNIFGGGDAKMIPAVMLWIGPSAAIEFIAAMAIAGGLCAFLVLIVRKTMPVEVLPGSVRAPFEKDGGVPYGVAIAIGVFAAGGSSPFLTGVLSQISVFG